MNHLPYVLPGLILLLAAGYFLTAKVRIGRYPTSADNHQFVGWSPLELAVMGVVAMACVVVVGAALTYFGILPAGLTDKALALLRF